MANREATSRRGWGSPLHNKDFRRKVLSSKTRRTSNRAARRCYGSPLCRRPGGPIPRWVPSIAAWRLVQEGEGDHRHRPQDRRSVLQHAPARYVLCRSRRDVLRRTLPATCPRQSPTAREVAWICFASGGSGPHPGGCFLGKLRRCWASRWRPATAKLDRGCRCTRTRPRHDRRGLRCAWDLPCQRAGAVVPA